MRLAAFAPLRKLGIVGDAKYSAQEDMLGGLCKDIIVRYVMLNMVFYETEIDPENPSDDGYCPYHGKSPV